MEFKNVLLGEVDVWTDVINYELLQGNAVWRFGLILIGIIITMTVGKIVQFIIRARVSRLKSKGQLTVVARIVESLEKPIYVAIFAVGLGLCKNFLYFDDESGITTFVSTGWTTVARVVGAVAVAYALYRLVDVVEYYLSVFVSKTESKLDDMLVPVVRKSMRLTIFIIAVLFVIELTVGMEHVKSVIIGAGVGGIAIALAAKDTIANFFGSITIFADRPFQIDELVRIGDHYGSVVEVGFRSTRIRTLQGHLVTIPNSTVVSANIENVGRRPYIRRTSNITITYDTGCEKTQKAVEIIKDVLAKVPEVNAVEDQPPRVYFSEFNDCSLNIYMTYWTKPADWWLYNEVNERVNLEIMKRFEEAKIEFAFPTQTVYLKKDEEQGR
jgi:MscS family membrane protein